MRNRSVYYLFLLWMALIACSPAGSSPEVDPTAPPLPAARKVTTIPDAENMRLELVADGFERPIFITHAGDGSNRLFIVEQTGRIWILQDGAILPDPFLDASDVAAWQYAMEEGDKYTENGLLGLAFHPNYAENGAFYIYYTDQSGDSALARYQADKRNPNRAELGSSRIMLAVDQPNRFHNGGMIAFGPDGYLYLGLGDGGPSNDPQDNGQRRETLLGSILRLDVSGSDEDGYRIPPDNPYTQNESGARPEIWAYGLRNPWRFSFDRATGDLWIGDVGELQYEEVNYQPANSAGGQNYGWDIYEGFSLLDRDDVAREEVAMPVFIYGRDHGVAITAGYVYRGEAIADLYGVFLFGDFGSGRIWTIYPKPDGGWQVNEYMDTEFSISSFGEDEAGELYVLDYFAGGIWKFVPAE